MIEKIALVVLLLSNIATLVWALKFRMKKHDKVDAMASLVRAFERNGEIILRVEKMDPSQFFLRAPQR
jgi:hypothetical protein